MVRVFQTFASERQLKKLTGNFDIESAKTYTPKPADSDYFPKNDVPWIKRFAQAGGRVIISGNTEMKSVPHERLALIECGMVVIFFESKWNEWGFFAKCSHLMHWWPVIAAKARTGEKGTFWHVPLNWSGQTGGKLRAVSSKDAHKLTLEKRVERMMVSKPSRPKDDKAVRAGTAPPDDLFSYASRRGNGRK